MTDHICPGNERVWMICYPHEHGLCPVEASCRYHEKDAWHALAAYVGHTVEEVKADKWVAKRFWLSLKRSK